MILNYELFETMIKDYETKNNVKFDLLESYKDAPFLIFRNLNGDGKQQVSIQRLLDEMNYKKQVNEYEDIWVGDFQEVVESRLQRLERRKLNLQERIQDLENRQSPSLLNLAFSSFLGTAIALFLMRFFN